MLTNHFGVGIANERRASSFCGHRTRMLSVSGMVLLVLYPLRLPSSCPDCSSISSVTPNLHSNLPVNHVLVVAVCGCLLYVEVPVVCAPCGSFPPVIPGQAEPALFVPASLPLLFPPLLFDRFLGFLLSVWFHSVSETLYRVCLLFSASPWGPVHPAIIIEGHVDKPEMRGLFSWL